MFKAADPSRVSAVGRLPARSGTAPTGRRPGRAPALGRGKKGGGSAGERRRRAGRPRLRARCPRGASRLWPLAVSESSASGGAAPRPQWNGPGRTASESRSCGGTGKGTRGGTASCGPSSPPCSPPAWRQLGSCLRQFPSRVPAVARPPPRSGTAPTGLRPGRAPAVGRGKGEHGGETASRGSSPPPR